MGTADLMARPDAARRARRRLSNLLAGQDQINHERAEQAQFLLSEVVANVSQHASTSACPLLRVLWIRTADILRTEVYDPDPRIPTVGAAGVEDEHGRGMWLLSAMADRWAAEPVPEDRDQSWRGGKVVWFAVRGVWNTQQARNPPSESAPARKDA